MRIFRSPQQMQAWAKSKRIGFVPTMGFLHEGHLSLVRRAKKENDFVVASIFVNPLQFGPKEDFKTYPRNITGDFVMLKKEKVDVVFVPTAAGMYPEGFRVSVKAGPVSKPLEGQFRPGHFDGVCTVVLKMFNLVQPARAYFGQKDFQQTRVIEQMVEDLNLPVKIVVCPTVREVDGLAMSSRNVYLNVEEQKKAPLIYEVLMNAKKELFEGKKIKNVKANAIKALQKSGFKVQYFSIASAETLEELEKPAGCVVIAVAASLGKTRLIDNILFSV